MTTAGCVQGPGLKQDTVVAIVFGESFAVDDPRKDSHCQVRVV